MNEDVIADLKQFIAATVRQELVNVATKDDLDSQINGLRTEMNTRFAQVDQRFDDIDAKLEAIADAHAETLADHEQRLSRLEHQTV